MSKILPFCVLMIFLVSSYAKTFHYEGEHVADPPEQSGTPTVLEDPNKLTDHLLANLGPFIDKHNLDPLDIGTQYNLKVSGLKNLERVGDVSVSRVGDTINTQASLALRNLRFTGHTHMKILFVNVYPQISGSVSVITASVGFVMSANGGKPRATFLVVNDIGDINVSVTGISIFNWIGNIIAKNSINSMKHTIKEQMAGRMLQTLNDALVHLPDLIQP